MPQLLDQYGRPVKTRNLTREFAAPSIGGVRNIWHASVASGLTPSKLAALLQGAAEGNAHDFLTLAEEMEERDAHYASVLGTRKRSVTGLEATVEAASEDKKDQDLAEELRAIVRSPEFGELMDDLLDALGKGYSACEIMWKKGARWYPERYVWRDPRFFVFDRKSSREIRLKDESDLVNGIPLPAFKFITHISRLKSGIPTRNGLARLVTWSYMFKAYTVKDWMSFCEVFGMPMRIGRFGPAASEDDKKTLLNAVVNLGSDAAAILPDSMKIEFEQAVQGKGGSDLFERMANWLDRQVSKAVLGQTMTTDDGSSLSQAQVHNEVRRDILKSDAYELQNTLNKYLVEPYIRINYGPLKQFPRIILPVPEPEDLALLTEAVHKLTPLGWKIDGADLRRKFNLPDPGDDAEFLGTPPAPAVPETKQAANRQARALNSSQNTDVLNEIEIEGMADWQEQMEPLVDPVRELVKKAGSFEELKAGLAELEGEMDVTKLTEALAEACFKADVVGNNGKT